MLGAIWRALVGRFTVCHHKWVIFKEMKLWDGVKNDIPIGTIYVMRCEHCGEITKKTVTT